jgi:REP element-mobilizing transposase RayT
MAVAGVRIGCATMQLANFCADVNKYAFQTSYDAVCDWAMARQRKHHQQLAFPKCDKNGQRRGGARRGAGRKPKDGRKRSRPGEPHKARPHGSARFPRHIVVRVTREVGSLRKRHLYAALRVATIAVAMRELAYDKVNGAFRIVHVSIQKSHLHLLVEADNKLALSRGMQSFLISAAKHINREFSVRMKLEQRRRGSVFTDRYHQEIIETPRQARHALAYVLNNWRKHREDRRPGTETWNVDPFSTGLHFMGWREREDAIVHWRGPDTYDPLVVYFPKTWLLSEGWKKAGKISFYEVPSSSGVATT